LWIKNIYIAAKQIINCNTQISDQPFCLFLQKLREKEYLHNHEVIRQVLSFENVCTPLGEHWFSKNHSQKKSKDKRIKG